MQDFLIGAQPQRYRLIGAQRPMLLELPHQAQHFAPVAECPMGAQGQPQRSDVALATGRQQLQRADGIVITMRLEVQQGLGHQARVAARALVVFMLQGTLQPLGLARAIAQIMGSARRHQCRQRRRITRLMGARGAVQGMGYGLPGG